jgi:hypothetical protein
MSNSVHVLPVDDHVEHTKDDSCVCGPRVEPAFLDDGSNGWVVVHHSLDGREMNEPGKEAMNITAKIVLRSSEGNGEYTRLYFAPDYTDGRNAAWAAATPALNLDMNVKAEVAGQFEVGKSYTLTFTED